MSDRLPTMPLPRTTSGRPQPVPAVRDTLDFAATAPLPRMGGPEPLRLDLARRALGLAPDPIETEPTVPEISRVEMARPLPLKAPARVVGPRRALAMTLFVLTNAVAIVGPFVVGASVAAVVGAVLLSLLGSLMLEAVVHRLFAHKAYRVGRVTQFVLATVSMMWPARGPIWWAATHRHHHKYADTPEDLHRPADGVWHAVIGWLFTDRGLAPDYSSCADLTRCVELRLLDRFFFVPFFASAFAAYWVGAFIDARWPGVITAGQALVWWGVLRAIVPSMLMNATNFFCHDARFGYRRFNSPDQTRNVKLLALPTAGLAWHNNHHAYQHSARNGFFPGELDTAWLFIRALAAVGLASGVRDVPPEVLAEGRETHRRGKPPAPDSGAREAA